MTGAKASAIFLVLFLVIVLGVGFTIGLTIRPGEWYQTLQKPGFTPPDWVFGPAWTLIYVLIAIAGWRVALTEGFFSSAFRLWGLQMILNWAWTPVFFGAHLVGVGLVVILALLAVAAIFMASVVDRAAFWCFVPYVTWLAYASALNAAIFALN